VEQSVSGMRRLIEELEAGGPARFQLFDGSPIPW